MGNASEDALSILLVLTGNSPSTPKLNARHGWVYVLPLLLSGLVFARSGWPRWELVSCIIPSAILLIGGPMSVCLHRYFAHTAFRASRAGQFALGVLGCMAWQKGPIWWAGKHRRHHKHCDAPNDPHSAVQTNFAYAWIGWTMSEKEAAVDAEFTTKLSSFPELRVLDQFWMVPPLLLNAAICCAWGGHAMVCLMTLPMLVCNLITLLFNVEYHPAHNPGKAQCKAVDNARFLSELVGESYHDDHHDYPRKAHRPGLDVPYWLMIKPLAALGLIWLKPEHAAAAPAAATAPGGAAVKAVKAAKAPSPSPLASLRKRGSAIRVPDILAVAALPPVAAVAVAAV